MPVQAWHGIYNPRFFAIFELGFSMPIYAYKCGSCGHSKDVLQKMSDAPLTECPACGAPQFRKQLTAAGFQLKGSGWYATDFKGGAAAGAAGAATAPASAAAEAGVSGSSGGAADAGPGVSASSSTGCSTGCACH
jgi:putative FmdB family regulatory protein